MKNRSLSAESIAHRPAAPRKNSTMAAPAIQEAAHSTVRGAQGAGVVKDTRSTAERILDAAEATFAREGYFAATIRGITKTAGVELSLSRYHFGTKDGLFQAVILRRARVTCEMMDHSLEEVLARQDPPSVQAVVEAMVAPALDRLSSGDPGWRHYLRLLAGLAHLMDRPELLAPWRDVYVPTATRYREALRAAMPHATDETVDWGLHFLHTLLGYALMNVEVTRYISGVSVLEFDWAELRSQLVRHVVGGLNAQAALGAVR